MEPPVHCALSHRCLPHGRLCTDSVRAGGGVRFEGLQNIVSEMVRANGRKKDTNWTYIDGACAAGYYVVSVLWQPYHVARNHEQTRGPLQKCKRPTSVTFVHSTVFCAGVGGRAGAVGVVSGTVAEYGYQRLVAHAASTGPCRGVDVGRLQQLVAIRRNRSAGRGGEDDGVLADRSSRSHRD